GRHPRGGDRMQAVQADAGAGPRPPAGPVTVDLVHRGLSIVAAIMLLTTLRTLWSEAIVRHPWYAAAMIAACAATLLAGVLAAVLPAARLLLVDAGIFLIALAELVTAARVRLVPGQVSALNDVGMVLQAGAAAISHGHHLYGVDNPDGFTRYAADG